MIPWLRLFLFTLVVFQFSRANASPTLVPTYVAPAISGNSDDAKLAQWALSSWQRASNKSLQFVPSPENQALLRIYWVDAWHPGGFGEMREIVVNGRPGAALYVNVATELLGEEIDTQARADRLYRDTIVYLTCVHELGHGLGLSHTADYQDIMYSFQFGGDIPGYFGRYRRRIQSQAQIALTDALSAADLRQFQRSIAERKSRPAAGATGALRAPASP